MKFYNDGHERMKRRITLGIFKHLLEWISFKNDYSSLIIVIN